MTLILLIIFHGFRLQLLIVFNCALLRETCLYAGLTGLSTYLYSPGIFWSLSSSSNFSFHIILRLSLVILSYCKCWKHFPLISVTKGRKPKVREENKRASSGFWKNYGGFEQEVGFPTPQIIIFMFFCSAFWRCTGIN